ncbi:MAG: hypothetical protein ACOCYT_00295 [Chloroflexota bacterium]
MTDTGTIRTLIRVDGGGQLGLGNVYRGLSVAAALVAEGMTTPDALRFLVGHDRAALVPVEAQGYHAEFIDMEGDLTAEVALHRSAVAGYRPRLVVTDVPARPDRPAEFFHSLRVDGVPTLLVHLSDENSGRSAADVVVEGDVHHMQDGQSTDSGTGTYPRTLRGPAYWLLNPAFADADTPAEASDDSLREGVFICLGGTDASGLSRRIPALAAYLPQGLQVLLVTGQATDQPDHLPPGWTHRAGLTPPEMAAAMRSHAVGITAGGVMMYEAASQGLPCVLALQRGAGQEPGSMAFNTAGVHLYAGYADRITLQHLAMGVNQLLADQSRRADRARATVDGRGVQRLLAVIREELP